MALGSELPQLDGYPFEVRYSVGARARATAMAELASDAYVYFDRRFSAVDPEIAIVVLDEAGWSADLPYGLPFFRDDAGELRPGIVAMPAGGGEFWTAITDDLRAASPRGYARLRVAYPDGAGGVNLQPFLHLITIHELAHAFEVLGDLRCPTFWISEIFVNLALHAFVATRRPASLSTLEALPTVGAGSRTLAARMRADGDSTLDELQAHYAGSENSMDPLNYVWFQYRWQRLAAELFEVDGEAGLLRFWECFHGRDRAEEGAAAASLAPLLTAEVSPTLGRAVRTWV